MSLLFPLRKPQRRHMLSSTSAFRALSLEPSNVFLMEKEVQLLSLKEGLTIPFHLNFLSKKIADEKYKCPE